MSRISQLGQSLVAKFGLSESESEEFVTSLFALIREKLLAEKIVKVKGLGTFKLAEMNARESVDVNTGERITIEGRYKLSFTPENAVRDRINAPFSSFESFDLDEDVDFSEIDKKYDSELVREEVPEETVAEPASETVAEPIVVPSAEPIEVKTEEPEAENNVESETASEEDVVESEPSASFKAALYKPSTEVTAEQEQPAKAVEPVAEPITQESQAVVSQVASAAETEVASATEPQGNAEVPDVETESSVPEPEAPVAEPETPATEPETPVAEPEVPVVEKDAPTVEPATTNPNTVRAPYCEELIREDMNHNKKVIKLLYWVIGLVVLLLISVGGYFVYNLGRDNAAKEYAQHQLVTEKAKGESPKPVAKSDANTKVEPAKTVAVPDSAQKAEPAKTETKPQVEQKPEPSVSDIYNNKDARVRTGAYNIVGTQTTVTLHKGQTLKSITKCYLGEGMECYIEAYNGKKTFNPGDKINIPKLELKKKRHKK